MSAIIPSPKFRNRRGWFLVSSRSLDDVIDGSMEARAAWNAVFDGFVCTRAEFLYGEWSVRYDGFHASFDEVDEGAVAPRYEAVITREVGDGGIVTFTAKFTK